MSGDPGRATRPLECAGGNQHPRYAPPVRHSRLISVLAALTVLAAVIPLSIPAVANVSGALTVGSTTIPAGGSTTVTASFTVSPPVGNTYSVQLVATPVGATTGSVTIAVNSTTGGLVCGPAGTVVTCTWPGAGNGSSATISATFTASGDASGTWSITSSYSNNRGSGTVASRSITVTPASADLAITKADSPDPVAAGSQLTYTLDYQNLGPSDATGVQILDTLPPGVTFVSASAGCTETAGTVTCDVGTVTAGGSGQVLIVVTIPPDAPSGEISNRVTIDSTTDDPTPDDNAVVAGLVVQAQGTTTTTTTPPSSTTTTTPGGSTTTTAPSTTTSVAGGGLPLTGADTRLPAVVGMAALLAGLVVLLRRRYDVEG